MTPTRPPRLGCGGPRPRAGPPTGAGPSGRRSYGGGDGGLATAREPDDENKPINNQSAYVERGWLPCVGPIRPRKKVRVEQNTLNRPVALPCSNSRGKNWDPIRNDNDSVSNRGPVFCENQRDYFSGGRLHPLCAIIRRRDAPINYPHRCRDVNKKRKKVRDVGERGVRGEEGNELGEPRRAD